MKKIKEGRSLILEFIVILEIVLVLKAYVCQLTIVNGDSMNNTLYDRDVCLIEKLSKTFHKDYERFDIIVFDSGEKDRQYFVKRVIGLPGETILMKDGEIFIDGNVIEDEYAAEVFEEAGIAAFEWQIGDHEYFVLGDNRNDSLDSRFIGAIWKENILGHVVFRLRPFGKIS